MLTGRHDVNELLLTSNNKRKGIPSQATPSWGLFLCFVFVVGILVFLITFLGYALLEPTACSWDLRGQVA